MHEAGAGDVGDVSGEREMRINSNTKIADSASKVKVVKDELSERHIEGSGIFLIWADRPIMMNCVLEGLRRRRLDDIHCEIWSTTERSCAIEVRKDAGEKYEYLGVIRIDMMVNRRGLY